MNVFTPAPAGVAATRQKNCNSCVQTKRRCDRRTPICSRCVEKKLPCVYGKAKAAKKPVQHGAEPSSITSYAASPMLANSASACSPFPSDISLDLGYLGNLSADLETELAQPAPTALDDDNISVGSFMNLINSTNPPPRDQWLVQAHDGYPEDRPGTPVDEEVQRSYQKISTFCVSLLYPGLSHKSCYSLARLKADAPVASNETMGYLRPYVDFLLHQPPHKRLRHGHGKQKCHPFSASFSLQELYTPMHPILLLHQCIIHQSYTSKHDHGDASGSCQHT